MATAKAASKPKKKAAPKVETTEPKAKAGSKAAKSKTKSEGAPPPKAESAAPPPGPQASGGANPGAPPFPPFETVLSPDQLKMVETLSANLARAAVTAQGAIAEAALRPDGLQVEIAAGEAETLPFADASFDTVLCTFTLCSVRSPAAVLAETRRVLRPGGRFLFCEHGLSPDPGTARWQRGLEPLWKRLAGGCHLTRPVTAAIEAAGFRLDEARRFYMDKTPRPLGWCEQGVARPA